MSDDPSGRRQRLESEIRALADHGRHRAATTVAIEGFGPEILGYLVGLLPQREADGYDLFQRWCFVVFEKLPSFRWESTFRTWGYGVAHNLLRGFLRRMPNRASRRAPHQDPELLGAVERVRTRTAPFLRTDVKDRVRLLREQLSASDQALLVLRVDRRLAWDECAQVLASEGEEVNARALARRMTRIRKRLRALSAAAGLLEGD